MIYRFVFKHFLSRMDSERAHRLALSMLRVFARIEFVRRLTNRVLGPKDDRIAIDALGTRFRTPLGLAAGFDKEALYFDSLAMLGFGHIELGTFTATPQPGNPRKRIERLLASEALVNWMGFPNPGAAVAHERLQGRRADDVVLGVNIGKSKDIDLDDAPADYLRAVRALRDDAKYLAVNVSSPNTANLRDLQHIERLAPIISAIREGLGGRRVPILIKISPDLSDEQVVDIGEYAVREEIDGLIAVNTTVGRDRLGEGEEGLLPEHPVGLSGRPLRERSIAVLRQLHSVCAGRVALISVGGIESADDVLARIKAGASLVQAHTAFIYQGPMWPHRVNSRLAKLVAAEGVASIQELVGKDAPAGVSQLGTGDAARAATPTFAH